MGFKSVITSVFPTFNLEVGQQWPRTGNLVKIEIQPLQFNCTYYICTVYIINKKIKQPPQKNMFIQEQSLLKKRFVKSKEISKSIWV